MANSAAPGPAPRDREPTGATPLHLPRRYRAVMATLTLIAGATLGLLVAAGPPAPVNVVLGVGLGLLAGVTGFLVLESRVTVPPVPRSGRERRAS